MGGSCLTHSTSTICSRSRSVDHSCSSFLASLRALGPFSLLISARSRLLALRRYRLDASALARRWASVGRLVLGIVVPSQDHPVEELIRRQQRLDVHGIEFA